MDRNRSRNDGLLVRDSLAWLDIGTQCSPLLHLFPFLVLRLAKTTVCITDCVMAELEKLGARFKLALTLAKDPRFKRIPCTHAGTYADDCLVNKVEQFKCYIIATCDRDLRRRIRKIPGIPIMYISQHKYVIERLPEAWGGA
jgi:U3 small nucleolar RNA-associated protein 24